MPGTRPGMTVTMRLGLAPKPSASEPGPLRPSLMGDCAEWRPPIPRHKSGLLAKYAKLVGQANLGAVTHEGGAEWPWFDH